MKNLIEILNESIRTNEIKVGNYTIMCEPIPEWDDKDGLDYVKIDKPITDFDNPEDFFIEENNFTFTAGFELTAYENNKIFSKIFANFEIDFNTKYDNIYLKDTSYLSFDMDDNGHPRISNWPPFPKCPPKKIADLIMYSLDNYDRLWEEMNKAFGYTKNEDTHELIYHKAFDVDLREAIANAYKEAKRNKEI